MKKGDTLVEVSLAIGIFSMVAIAAVSVINGSTTGAQSSLEATITRQEIDGQAEALRFIQSAYAAGGEENDETRKAKYEKLWDTIVNRAIDLSKLSDTDRKKIFRYTPATCAELYNFSESADWSTLKKQKAFLINTRGMSSNNINEILVPYSPNIFYEASTYPRIIYNGITSDALYNSNIGSAFKITRAEGIYIIGVYDKDGTVIVNSNNGAVSKKPAYIDFYIRSCWFTPSSDRPSTISTTIRLYDPTAAKVK